MRRRCESICLNEHREVRQLIRRLIFISVLLSMAATAIAGDKRDILLEIVSNCVDTSRNDYCNYCRWPVRESPCAISEECRKTTEVWNLSASFAAIRDIKMCGCPTEFVHGLALPRIPVKGVEDPNRPSGIWQFAWDVARSRIDPSSIALVVNPAHTRSQDQLHIHLLKLRPDRLQLLKASIVGYQKNLDEVWRIAADGAQLRGLKDYGVLVMRSEEEGGFAVAVTEDSPETAFTEWQCQ
jgi:CDP-diacylglycerol pyrophosphatase